MFIKSDIRKVTIALEKSLGHKIYVRIGQEGIIHLARVQTGDVLMDTKILAEEGRTRDIIAGSGFVLNALKIEPEETFVSVKQRDTEKDALFVSNAKRVMERLHRLRDRIQEESAIVAEQLEYAEALSRMGVDSQTMKKARLARMVFGQFTDAVPVLPVDGPFIMAGMGRYVFGAALPKDAPRMLQFLDENGFTDKTAEISGASSEGLKRRADSLKRRLEILDTILR